MRARPHRKALARAACVYALYAIMHYAIMHYIMQVGQMTAQIGPYNLLRCRDSRRVGRFAIIWAGPVPPEQDKIFKASIGEQIFQIQFAYNVSNNLLSCNWLFFFRPNNSARLVGTSSLFVDQTCAACARSAPPRRADLADLARAARVWSSLLVAPTPEQIIRTYLRCNLTYHSVCVNALWRVLLAWIVINWNWRIWHNLGK